MEPTPIGSLYHHLHNSAAISAALYAQDESEHSEPPFMIIAADLNGIQNYLYDLNPENSSKASKLLRSRSFQIQMIMEMLADKVISELGLSHLSVISSQGGKWFILANNSKNNEQKMEELKQIVNEEECLPDFGTD
jgi:CRISPR-associated protein Csm1